jgi:hypothetical protein
MYIIPHPGNRYCGMVNEEIVPWSGSLLTYRNFMTQITKRLHHDPVHRSNVCKILECLALSGKATTWDIRKYCFPSLNDKQADSMVRRILVGRKDRGRISKGLVDYGLVERIRNTSNTDIRKYKLTIHGLLYSSLESKYTSKQWYQIARHNEELIPHIFRQCDYLENNRVTLNLVRSIANGEFPRMDEMRTKPLPYHEINDYLRIKFAKKLGVSEFAEFIAFWFYTFQMYVFWAENKETCFKRWKKLVSSNAEINKWYSDMINEVLEFYQNRGNIVNSLRF